METMNSDLVLIDREALLAELHKAFDPETAEILLSVLDRVAAQVREAGVTREDFRALREVVAELAAAHERAEERLSRLEAAVERLVEAINRQDKRIDGLTDAVDGLRKQVGGLSETVGGDIEDIAYIVLHDVLKREFGWEVGVLERSWQTWGEEPEEVNIFGIAVDPTRSEETIWIVGEAKHNVTLREARKFIDQLGRARRSLEGEVFPVCFCYRARPEVQELIRESGIRLVFSYGKLV